MKEQKYIITNDRSEFDREVELYWRKGFLIVPETLTVSRAQFSGAVTYFICLMEKTLKPTI